MSECIVGRGSGPSSPAEGVTKLSNTNNENRCIIAFQLVISIIHIESELRQMFLR